MSKRKVLVFSDCYIYGGSERLMSFLFSNKYINEKWNLAFAYRKHSLYEEGMAEDFSSGIGQLYPLKLLSNDTLFYRIKSYFPNKILATVLKLPFSILYYIGVYSTFNFFVFLFCLIRVRPHVLHINNGGYPAARTCNLLVLVAKLMRVEKIVYQVNNQAEKPRIVDGLRNFFVRNAVSKFITASKMAQQNLHKNILVPLEKIQVVRNVVKSDVTESTENLLQKNVIRSETLILVQVAFLTARKGQVKLLETISDLKKQSLIEKHILLILIGDGEDRSMLLEYCKKEDLESNVLFLGYKKNYADYLKIADIVVLPSLRNEDLPLVVIESLMLGKCILSTSLAGIAEVIEDGKNGILVQPNQDTIVAELAESIVWLTADNDRRKKIEEKALESSYVFSEKKYAESLNNIYGR